MAWGPLRAETVEGERLAIALRGYLDTHRLSLRALVERGFPYSRTMASERLSGQRLAEEAFIRALVATCDDAFPDLAETALKTLLPLAKAAYRAAITNGSGNTGAGGEASPPDRRNDVPRRRGTSRERILSRLRDGRHFIVLTGMLGIGKSWLAREHAERHWSSGRDAWIIDAGRPELIRPELARLARRLDLAGNGALDRDRGVQSVLGRLASTTGWLMVFDDAEQPDDMMPEIRKIAEIAAGRGQLLITSRDPAWREHAKPLPVPALDRSESMDLLRSMPRPIAHDLAEALGDLPLALRQAAAFCQDGLDPADYLLHLVSDGRSFLSQSRPVNYPQSLTQAFTDRFTSLIEAYPEAAEVFRHPSPLTRRTLTAILPVATRRTAFIRNSQRHGLTTYYDDHLHLHPSTPLLSRH